MLGYSWPEADEAELLELSQVWMRFSGTVDGIVSEAHSTAATVWSEHEGLDISAFQDWWHHEESPAATLVDGGTAAILTGTGLVICAMIILALKIAVIVQLVILVIEIDEAIATAVPSCGASLAEIPIFQQLARTFINNLKQEALWKLIG